ncbi:MAG: 5'/3'-nucleotidase SurE [Acidobacteria bacterium]|nr:5'/3'-nucleotidase SurE [Acidobacteriota bacterium]
MKKILVTNDDGVRSEGLTALADALKHLGEVVVVAPAKEASAVGHALTLHHPLRLERMGEGVYAVDGTPTDCVNIAVAIILKDLPDLVVSGINTGWNLGDDVTYSGTVSGALEGALLGVPSLAVSLERTRERFDFSKAAGAAAQIAERVLENGLPPRTLLNINVPRVVTRGFKVTVQAKRNHVTSVDERVDPKRRPYYWIDEALDEWEPHDRSDYQAVREGYISVTPLQPDLTAHDALRLVERLLKPVAATTVMAPGVKRLVKRPATTTLVASGVKRVVKPVATVKRRPSRRLKGAGSRRR